MLETIVTRGGQVTLAKDVREKLKIKEGDTIMINTIGETAVISKRDPSVLKKHNFLPDNFEKNLKESQTFSMEDRLKRLKII